MGTPQNRTLDILLVEDNPGDAKLVQEALKGNPRRHQLHVVEDGESALHFLRQRGPFSGTRRPDLILLDLNLPRKDGREVLAEIKDDPKLCSIPVVVLSTSRADDDIAASYRLHANCYITKPMGFTQFVQVVKSIELFWLSTIQLPNHDPD